MSGLLELAERMWSAPPDTMTDVHPVYLTGLCEEVLDGVLVYKGTATITAIDTGDALVMLDTGKPDESDNLLEQIHRWRPHTPIEAVVYSHHHLDHVGGAGALDADGLARFGRCPTVYAHDRVAANFDRYRRTRGYNAIINRRQSLHDRARSWPGTYRYPDVTYPKDLTFRSGGLTFELHHAVGETDDHTWTWIPELSVLHTGDLFIWAVPNAGNPQKVQRYAGGWAEALRAMADLGAAVLLPGHGLPIIGADRVAQALDNTATLLETIEEQTVGLMNEGRSLDEILHEVDIPENLLAKPYLRPVYDDPAFIIRNVWRQFGGWYDGQPDQLLPAPRASLAHEIVTLSGGLDRVLDRVRALSKEEEWTMACHLVELTVLADPGSDAAHDLRADVYGRRAETVSSSIACHILRHAATSSRARCRDLASSEGEYRPDKA